MREMRHIRPLLGTSLLCGGLLSGCDSGSESEIQLAPPALVGPADDARFPALSLVEFSWGHVEGAAAYEFRIQYQEYPSADVSGVVVDTNHVETLAERIEWFRRRRAEAGSGEGPNETEEPNGVC